MRRLRWSARLFVVAVVSAGALALALGAAGATWPDSRELLVAAPLFVLATVAQLRPIHLGQKLKFTVEDLATFAAVLVLPPFLAIALATLSTFIGLRFTVRMALYNRAFNAATNALATGAGALCVVVLRRAGTPVLDSPLAILTAAIAMYGVRTLLVDTVIGLQLHRDPLRHWWQLHRNDLPHEAALFALGALAALSIDVHPAATILFAVPMALIYLVWRTTTRLRQQTKAAILELADLIDRRDKYTYGHSQRVAAYSARLATSLRLDPAQIELIEEAARLHDIGKIRTEDRVLQKPGPLDSDERAHMCEHADEGYRFLTHLTEFWEGAELVRSHHERLDGGGYPRRLRGLDVPLEASVIAICDAYDAMTSDRPYRRALSWERVRLELVGGRGTQWHERAVDAMLLMIEEEHRAKLADPHVLRAEPVQQT